MDVVIWVAAVVAALALGGGIWFWRRRRRLTAIIAQSTEERAQFDKLEPQAQGVLAELAQLITVVEGKTNQDLVEHSTALAAALENARPAVAALAQSIEESPNPDDADQRYHAADRLVSVAERHLKTAEKLLTTANGRIQALESANQGLISRVATARSATEAQGESGWRIDALLVDVVALEHQIQAIDLTPPIDLESQERTTVDLQQRIDALAAEAAELPDQYRELLGQSGEFRDRAAALESDRSWLENQLEAWALVHHWQSFASVSEHPPSVEGRLTEANELLTKAASDGGMLDMDVQDVRGAAAAMQRVSEVLDQGEQMMDQARNLNVDLARSAVEADELVPVAEQASTTLAQYVAEHPHDLNKNFAEPAGTLRTQVDEAASLLELRPPDTLGAMNLSNQAIADASRLLKEAKAEVARMDKLRSEARRAIARARSAVNDLDRYTDGILAGIFGGSRRTNVERLQNSLRSAERKNEVQVNKPDSARREAESIADEATRLLKKYKRADAD